MKSLCSLALLAALLAAGPVLAAAPEVPDGAFAQAALDNGEPRVSGRLLVDAASVSPGSSVAVGVLLELERGWHVYWRNPGEAGLSTRVVWSGDANVGALAWPAPRVFDESDGAITTFGYADEVLLAAAASIPADAAGRVELGAEVDLLVCEVQCIPGQLELRRSVPVASATRPAPDEVAAVFEHYASLVPEPATAAGFEVEVLLSQSAIRPGDRLRGAIALVHADGTLLRAVAGRSAFVPDDIPGLELVAQGSEPHPLAASGLLVHFEARALPDGPDGAPPLRGVVALGGGRAVEVDLPLPWAAPGAAVAAVDNPWLVPPPDRRNVGLWRAVLLALLGGLILNLMPCVLPVLAIKVAGLADLSQQRRGEMIGHGVAYTAGILLSMAALAAVVVGLREAGTRVGWGFQFQEPLFVAAISAVLLLFALNLFGVFEIYLGATRLAALEAPQASGRRRSFFEGLLAVLVATPCSAPFLGTAVGFAFASPAPTILAIFTAVGLGLAAPYLLITLVPAWARWVPRSGPWMLKLRALLGFFLLATVAWLLWVQGRATGSDGMAGLLVFLLVLAFAAWLYGIAQASSRLRAAVTGVALLLVIGAAGALTLPTSTTGAPAREPEAGALGWQPYAPAAIADSLASGRVVFVDFTADWCITCKLNERAVLASARVAAEIERLDVALYKADWTRRDPQIRAELARHGRAGVPMYLIYSPDRPLRPRILPELLSVDGLIDALRGAAPAGFGQPVKRREAA